MEQCISKIGSCAMNDFLAHVRPNVLTCEFYATNAYGICMRLRDESVLVYFNGDGIVKIADETNPYKTASYDDHCRWWSGGFIEECVHDFHYGAKHAYSKTGF